MAQDPRSLFSDGREQVVQNAIFENDVTKLREISLLPGGFKEARRHAWCVTVAQLRVISDISMLTGRIFWAWKYRSPSLMN